MNTHIPLTKVCKSTNSHGLRIPKGQQNILWFDLTHFTNDLGFSSTLNISDISECLDKVQNNVNNTNYLLALIVYKGYAKHSQAISFISLITIL